MAEKSYIRRQRRTRIKKHVRKKITGTSQRPRLCVFRSIKAIYVQCIDDTANRTLFSVSSLTKALEPEVKKAKGKVAVAAIVGKAAAEEAKKHKIDEVVFDRNGYLYHGRVKALADAAREAGLKF
ncbi:50S ribosomal protein L18 [bacterium]|nr:50S ribosomal protein L18 [bacterium]